MANEENGNGNRFGDAARMNKKTKDALDKLQRDIDSTLNGGVKDAQGKASFAGPINADTILAQIKTVLESLKGTVSGFVFGVSASGRETGEFVAGGGFHFAKDAIFASEKLAFEVLPGLTLSAIRNEAAQGIPSTAHQHDAQGNCIENPSIKRLASLQESLPFEGLNGGETTYNAGDESGLTSKDLENLLHFRSLDDDDLPKA